MVGLDVPEPTVAGDFYITDFFSREVTGQDLDVAAPGSWVVGPFQLQRGQTSWFFVGGTSMAAPHVTVTVALLLEENPSLTQAQAEATLQNTAIPIGPGCRSVILVPGGTCVIFHKREHRHTPTRITLEWRGPSRWPDPRTDYLSVGPIPEVDE